MVKIYTDTSANLPNTLIKKYGITVIPFTYTVDGNTVTHTSGNAFCGKEYYGAIRNGAVVKTSMINTDAYINAFSIELKKGNDVIYLGMSSGVSGAVNAAKIAVSELKESFPTQNIAVIDTLAASLGEGMQVLAAAEKVAAGFNFFETVDFVNRHRDKMCQYFTVDDLLYLKRGGRLSSAAQIVGTVLNIKPVLTGNDEGKIVIHSKVRGRKTAIAALANRYDELVCDKSAEIGIAHADDELAAEQLLNLLKSRGFSGNAITVCYEPVTGAHVGPGTLALFFWGSHK